MVQLKTIFTGYSLCMCAEGVLLFGYANDSAYATDIKLSRDTPISGSRTVDFGSRTPVLGAVRLRVAFQTALKLNSLYNLLYLTLGIRTTVKVSFQNADDTDSGARWIARGKIISDESSARKCRHILL